MARTNKNVTLPSFIVDPSSVARSSGRQIAWGAIASTDTSFIVDGKKVLKPGTIVGAVAGKVAPVGIAAIAATSATSASDVITVTKNDHGYAVGDVITTSGGNKATANGTVTITAVTTNTFDYAATGTTVDGAVTGLTFKPAPFGVLVSDAAEGQAGASLSGYGVLLGGVFYENLMPDASGSPKRLSAELKAALKASGYAYAFEVYGDNRAS